jgi:hypothetical protein
VASGTVVSRGIRFGGVVAWWGGVRSEKCPGTSRYRVTRLRSAGRARGAARARVRVARCRLRVARSGLAEGLRGSMCRTSLQGRAKKSCRFGRTGCHQSAIREATDDDELIAAVAGGDDAGLRELFSRHALWPAARLRGDVKRAMIRDHVEPFRRRRSCGETSSTAAPRPFRGSPVRPRECRTSPSGHNKALLAEPISLRSPHWPPNQQPAWKVASGRYIA